MRSATPFWSTLVGARCTQSIGLWWLDEVYGFSGFKSGWFTEHVIYFFYGCKKNKKTCQIWLVKLIYDYYQHENQALCTIAYYYFICDKAIHEETSPLFAVVFLPSVYLGWQQQHTGYLGACHGASTHGFDGRLHQDKSGTHY